MITSILNILLLITALISVYNFIENKFSKLNEQLKKQLEKDDRQSEALKHILSIHLKTQYDNIQKGHTNEELKMFYDCYTAYYNLGGNGFIQKLKENVDKSKN